MNRVELRDSTLHQNTHTSKHSGTMGQYRPNAVPANEFHSQQNGLSFVVRQILVAQDC